MAANVDAYSSHMNGFTGNGSNGPVTAMALEQP